jgi:hypothetical protein
MKKGFHMPRLHNLLCILSILILFCGCAMFSAWQSIPPPGGCDQCHTLPINANWKVAYQAPILNDERNRDYFKTSEYNMPKPDQPSSSLEVRKVQEQKCFECHKAPNASHKGRMGRFHH